MCSERILVRAGGETGQHVATIAAPLLIHDLPVTAWWPEDVPFQSRAFGRLRALSDRLVVDGASWSGDGLDRLRRLAKLVDRPDLAVSDFALVRQSRWREAIASTFDSPDLRPYLGALRRIEVTYAARRDGAGLPAYSNVVKPIYHVAWLASRLGLSVIEPLRPVRDAAHGPTGTRSGMLRQGRSRVEVVIRPKTETAAAPSGTTLSVSLDAVRRGVGLSVTVTAQARTVTVEARHGGHSAHRRVFQAQRRTEVDMLAEVIESLGRNRLAAETTRMAVALLDAESPEVNR
jgi:glucose-6-phosphate dehydrogenase assembly protein OpcA